MMLERAYHEAAKMGKDHPNAKNKSQEILYGLGVFARNFRYRFGIADLEKRLRGFLKIR
jgi:hypothetical protein